MRSVVIALGIGALATIMGLQFANISNKIIRGCSPFAPDVVEWKPGVKLCEGQTVILPAPKKDTNDQHAPSMDQSQPAH